MGSMQTPSSMSNAAGHLVTMVGQRARLATSRAFLLVTPGAPFCPSLRSKIVRLFTRPARELRPLSPCPKPHATHALRENGTAGIGMLKKGLRADDAKRGRQTGLPT